MKLNEMPTKTTNGFGVNSLELDLDVKEDLSYANYKVKNYDLKSNLIDKSIHTKLGLDINKYYESNINIDDNYKEPIIIELDINGNMIDKININSKSNSSASIIIIYRGSGYHYLVMDNNIGEYSNINLSIINLLDSKSTNLVSITNKVLDNGVINSTLIDLEGNIKLSNYYSELVGYKSSDYLNTIYYGTNNDLIDCNYDIKNIGKSSNSNINSIGILDKESIKTMRMNIDFISGCSKSIGEEREKCILLSDKAKSSSVPLLLCSEEDVSGVHSVSTGKVEEDKLFYVMSRGFSYKDAIKIIINGDLNRIINNIEDDNIKEEIINKINEII